MLKNEYSKLQHEKDNLFSVNQKILQRLNTIQKSKIKSGEIRFDQVVKGNNKFPPPALNKVTQTDTFFNCKHEKLRQNENDKISYLKQQNETFTEINDLSLNSLSPARFDVTRQIRRHHL